MVKRDRVHVYRWRWTVVDSNNYSMGENGIDCWCGHGVVVQLISDVNLK